MKPETKVGLMVFISLGGLIAAILWLKGGVGKMVGGEHPFKVNVVFSTLGDLKPDALVKFQEGPTIGRVRGITIDPKDRITKVHVGIDPSYLPLLSKNARIRIGTQGLLGEKYINIIPGTKGGPGDEPLVEGVTLQGDEEGTLANLQSQAITLMKTLQSSLSTADKAIHTLVPRLNEFAERANRIAEAVYNDERALSRRLNSLGDQMVKLSKRLNDLLDKHGDGVSRTVDDAQAAIADLKVTSQSVRKTATEIEKLAGDPKVHEDVRDLVKGAKAAVADVSRITGSIAGLKTELGYQGDYVVQSGASALAFGNAQSDGTLSGGQAPVAGSVLSKVYLRVSPSEKKYYHLGVSNLSTGSSPSQTTYVGSQDPASGRIVLTQAAGPMRPTFDVLYAHSLFPGLYARGGLLENSGGVGLDWRLFKNNLAVQADAYGFGSAGALGRVGLFYRPGPLRIGAMLDRLGTGNAYNVRVGVGIELDDPDIRYLIGLLGLSATLYK